MHLASSASLTTTTGWAPEKYCMATLTLQQSICQSLAQGHRQMAQQSTLAVEEVIVRHLEHFAIFFSPLCVHDVRALHT